MRRKKEKEAGLTSLTLERVGKKLTIDEHVSRYDTDVGSLSENVE